MLLRAFLLGIVSGQRSMLGPAVTSWATRCGTLQVKDTPMAFMESPYLANTLALLSAGELVADKLPSIPSRKSPPAFAARIASGTLVGATVGASDNMMLTAALVGAAGAVVGTLGGSAARAWLAEEFNCDLPAALLEDAVAITLALTAVARKR